MLTEEEVAGYLGVQKSEVEHLVKRGKLTAFRVGGEYVRFRKEEVVALKAGKKFVPPDRLDRNWLEKAADFWKFYSFYILSSVLLLLMVAIFLQLQ